MRFKNKPWVLFSPGLSRAQARRSVTWVRSTDAIAAEKSTKTHLTGTSRGCRVHCGSFFKNTYMYVFIWLLQALVAAHRIFSFGMWTLSCGMWDLVPWPGIQPGPPALRVLSLSHGTTREIPTVALCFVNSSDPLPWRLGFGASGRQPKGLYF